MNAPTSGLDIRVLGPLEVLVDGVPIVVDTRKALAILAILAVEQRAFAREELAALLWPESADESARGALRRTLSVLRSALGDRWLRVDRTSVSLDIDGVSVDLDELERVAAASPGTSPRAGSTVAIGVDLVRGPFLVGFSLRDSSAFDDWHATRATHVERQVKMAFDRLAEGAAEAGDLGSAIRIAEHRLGVDTLDEPAHRHLIALHAQAGDRTAAIRQYRTCVAIFERELGVAPLAETTELYEAIRDGAPVAVPSRLPARTVVARARIASDSISTAWLPLVGRDDELAALIEAHRTASSAGRVAVIEGEAGIGKTRLGDALASAVAASGGRVLTARAFETEAAIPYGPIVDLLREGLTAPDAAARLSSMPAASLAELDRLVALPAGLVVGTARSASVDPDVGRIRLLEAVATALPALASSPDSPGLLRIDDLQWADEATREFLGYLLRRLAGRPMLVQLAWRREDMDARAEAFASLVEAIPESLTVRLRRLDYEAIRALVTAAWGPVSDPSTIETLAAESEGLPLYLVEALTAGPEGDAPVRRGIRAMMQERLGRLSETATQVLGAAAAIGRSFDLEIVRVASGRSDAEVVDALDELVRRGIIREAATAGDAPRYDFAHAMLRDEAYGSTSLARRRLLHRRVADQLRADAMLARDATHLAQLAHHERAAGREAAAAEAFRAAGSEARRVYANREALEHLEMALALGHPDATGLQLAIGQLRTTVGDYAGAIIALEAAAASAGAAVPEAIELQLGRIHARRGDLGLAASHLDAVIDADHDGALDDHRILTAALVERAFVSYRARDLAAARASAIDARSLAELDGERSGAGAAHRLLGLVALEQSDLMTARVELERSLALADPDLDPQAAIAAGNALALVEASLGDRDGAIGRLESALEACRRTGDLHLEAAVENNLADQLHAAGRPDEAMDHLKRAVALFAEVGGRAGELEPEIWKLVAW